MPCAPCKHPTCAEIVAKRGDYCPDHAHLAQEMRRRQPPAARRAYHQVYDAHRRNPDAVEFYHSTAWANARGEQLANFPVCRRCNAAWSKHVHHIKALADCTPEERVAQSNLYACCHPCHSAIEAEVRKCSSE